MVLDILVLIQLLAPWSMSCSVMYTASIVGKAQVKPKLNSPLQHSYLSWFAHTRPSYLEFEQIPIGDVFKIVTRKNFGHE